MGSGFLLKENNRLSLPDHKYNVINTVDFFGKMIFFKLHNFLDGVVKLHYKQT